MIQNVYIASCCREGGIYHYRMDDSGKCTLAAFTPADRPMFMAISENKLYVTLRDPWENGESAVMSFEMDAEGFLRNPSEIYSAMGSTACHILADKGEVYCANYRSGSVIKLPDTLVQHTGCGPNRDRQESAHPHFVGLTPDRKYVCTADLGTDTIYLYDRELNLQSRARAPQGHGPRHLAFHDSGRYVFCANELKSTVSVYAYREGYAEHLNLASALPEGYGGESYVAAIRVLGDEVFVSNRGHDSVSRMRFSEEHLTLVETIDCRGQTPRDIWLAGKYLLSANQDSDTVTVLDLEHNGSLADVLNIPVPLCILTAEVEANEK